MVLWSSSGNQLLIVWLVSSHRLVSSGGRLDISWSSSGPPLVVVLSLLGHRLVILVSSGHRLVSSESLSGYCFGVRATCSLVKCLLASSAYK